MWSHSKTRTRHDNNIQSKNIKHKNYEDGDLENVYIENKVNSLQSSWVKRL